MSKPYTAPEYSFQWPVADLINSGPEWGYIYHNAKYTGDNGEMLNGKLYKKTYYVETDDGGIMFLNMTGSGYKPDRGTAYIWCNGGYYIMINPAAANANPTWSDIGMQLFARATQMYGHTARCVRRDTPNPDNPDRWRN